MKEAAIYNISDPMTWARMNRIYTDWVKQNVPLGFELKKFLIGDAVKSIIGDDSGSIASVNHGRSGSAEIGRQQLLERLDWEISLKVLPRSIMQRLNQVKKEIERQNWSDESEFQNGKTMWVEQIRDFTIDLTSRDKKLQQAIQYCDDNSETFAEEWHKYRKTMIGV